MQTYDVVIIGGGIAGCYAAYRLRQLHPAISLIVVESEDRLGGRAQTEMFQGVPVVTGAGVGRLHKDRLLLKLLAELKFRLSKHETAHHVSACDTVSDAAVSRVARDFTALKAAYVRKPVSQTFKAFAQPRLLRHYESFVANVGYSDFEEADAGDVFRHYGFEDNYAPWTAFLVPWSDLIAAMTQGVPCLLRTRVTRLARLPGKNNTLRVETTTTPLHARRVIIATNAATLQALLPVYSKIYAHIHGQPFLRVYGAFTPASTAVLMAAICSSGVTVLPDSPLQKVLHMKDGVFMVAYCDNANALYLRRHVANLGVLCGLLERGLGLDAGVLHMTASRAYYWNAGTHYYDPLHTSRYASREVFLAAARHPAPRVFVVGECVALHQGWVEGALETVEDTLRQQFKQSRAAR